MSTQSDDQKKQWNITGIGIPAGLFIGMGVGFLVDNITAGIFLGLGGGFLAMMIGMLILRIRR
ncbi:hypothetical protein ACFLW0_03275 [Chloroflexota bacterium]